ncbi:phage head-tail connector protein [Methylosinus sp. H3A]|uniref:head-tail connector protein n=1 Tax=Methylosinus sp. H3A TaxID=2785786 RepID=UPI0018C2B1E1|nr:head-tail connector protein [Methylosinus sp. H3A]MBG0810583.1 phage head-tail connector protein [Methylosinus sp. H3A]
MVPELLFGPALEPVSLDDAKAWLRLDSSDEDQLLSALIVSARMTVEAYARRFFVTQSWRMRLDAWPPHTLRRRTLAIPFAPFRSVSAIRVFDSSDVSQTLPGASYRAPATRDSGRVVFADAPAQPGRARDGIEIDVVAGYGDAATDTPEPLRRAILALVAHWHENRGDAGDVGAPLPTLVVALAKPFRRERLT